MEWGKMGKVQQLVLWLERRRWSTCAFLVCFFDDELETIVDKRK